MNRVYYSIVVLAAFLLSLRYPSAVLGAESDIRAAFAPAAEAPAFAFEQNNGQIVDTRGQLRPDILYSARAGGVQVYISQSGVHYVFANVEELPQYRTVVQNADGTQSGDKRSVLSMHRVDMHLVGARPSVDVEAEQARDEVSHYYLPHCPQGLENVRRYGRLVYKQVYPNIDLVLTAQADRLKYDFIVHPGGDPAVIALQYTAADRLRTEPDGSLTVQTPMGEIREDAPFIYQKGGFGTAVGQSTVPGRFVVDGATVRFAIGDYDRNRTLVIDPGVLWSTFYGGDEQDFAYDITTDMDNNVVVTGMTHSYPFAATPGSFQDTILGDRTVKSDVFLSKFNRRGQRLWSTYLGGSEQDVGRAVACDSLGSIIVGGQTLSPDLPDTLGAIDTLFGSSMDCLIFKFTRNGLRTWGTFLGGQYADRIFDIAAGRQGEIFLVGTTNSDRYTFPLVNAFQRIPGGDVEVFIARMSLGGGILWNTFYGGSEAEQAGGLALNYTDNRLYIVGSTFSDDLPLTSSGFQPTSAGAYDAFVLRMDLDGDMLGATYYGGSEFDYGYGIGYHPGSNSIVFGGTTTSFDLPIVNGVQPTRTGNYDDAFVVKMSNDTRQQRWSTYYGGSSADQGLDVAVSIDGSVAVVGMTSSANFSVTANAMQSVFVPSSGRDINFDPFLLVLTPDGDTTLASYYGSSRPDQAEAVTFDRMGNVLMVGWTSGGGFPTKNAHQPAWGGNIDGFIMRYGCDVELAVTPNRNPTFCAGGTVTIDAGTGFSGYLWNTGATTQSITVSTSGQYTVTVTDNLQCSKLSTTVVVTVHPLPQPVFVATTPTVICEGNSLQLMLTAPYKEYRWSDNSTAASLTVTQSGVYSVTVTDNNGCSAVVSTTITVVPVPQAAVRTLMDFGELPSCRSNGGDTITIVNTGNEKFDITAVEITNGATDFALLTPITSPVEVQPNTRRQFFVRFQPQGLGAVQGTLKFTLSPCGREYVVELRGRKDDSASVAFSASTIDMGATFLCAGTPLDTTLTLYNRGTGPIDIESSTLAAPFALSGGELPATIAAGDSVVVSLRFTPAAAGKVTAELALPYAAGTCRDTLLFSLLAEARDAQITADASSVDFGSLTGCEESTVATVRLQLDGTVGATVTAVEGDVNFGSGESLPIELTTGAGAQRDILLKFQPVSEGTFAGTLTLRYTVGPCTKEVEIAVAGSKQGVSFAAPETVNFGEVVGCVAQSSSATISLGAAGAEGRVTSVAVTGPFETTIADGDVIPAGGSKQYDIRFLPTAEGQFTGTVTVELEPCGIRKVIALSGRRTEAQITAVEPLVDYGTVAAGQTPTRTVTVRNTGSAAMEIGSIEGPAAPFAVADPQPVLPVVLQPGEELSIDVEFTSQPGEQTGLVRFAGTRPCERSVEVQLRGIGESETGVRGRAHIAVPASLRADVRKKGFGIPVVLVSQTNLEEAGAGSFRVVLEFDATMFAPTGVQPGAIVSNTVDATGTRVVEIAVDAIAAYEPGHVLVELTGDVLLGEGASTPVRITAFEWTTGAVDETTTEDGLLTAEGLCEADGTRLLEYKQGFGIQSVNPNPASDGIIRIDVWTVEEAETTLEIYNSQGRLVFEERWFARQDTRNIVVNNPLAAGVYTVVLRSPARSDSETLIISR